MPQLKSKTTRDRRLTEALTHRDGAGLRRRRHRPALAAGPREGQLRPAMGRRGGLSAARRCSAVGRREPRPPTPFPPLRAAAHSLRPPSGAAEPVAAAAALRAHSAERAGAAGTAGRPGACGEPRCCPSPSLGTRRGAGGARRGHIRCCGPAGRSFRPCVSAGPPARPRTHASVRQPCPHTRGAPRLLRPVCHRARAAPAPCGGEMPPREGRGQGLPLLVRVN